MKAFPEETEQERKIHYLGYMAANHIDSMLAYWDKNEVCLFANDAYKKWFGKSSEDMIGKITMKELLGSLYDKNLPYIKGALSGVPQVFEREIITPQGIRNSIAHYYPDMVNNTTNGFYVYVSDVTNFKDTEKKLKASELKFRQFLESAPDAVVIIDQSGNIEAVNAQTENLFGYNREELTGKQIEFLIPEKLRSKHLANRALFSKSPHVRPMGAGMELFALKKDGVEFPVEISISPIHVYDRMYVSAAIRDISARKEEEKMIYQLATIIESTDDGIISKTLDGYILTWNRGAEKIFGYTRQEAVGRNISLLFPSELLEEETELMDKVMKGYILSQYETVRMRKDHAKINVAITLSPIKNKTGTIVGVSKIVRDITKQKEEQEKLKLFAILESKSKEMEQFAYIASHDLREPLLTIKNYVELFIADYGATVEREPKRYLNSILKATNRMDTLIHALLEYSKLSKIKQVQEVNCNDMLEQVKEDLGNIITKTKATITNDNLPVIKAYPVELKLLFQNLLVNAMKYHKPNTLPEVNISARKFSNFFEFRVMDNGIGIAEENKERIFLMFQRLHKREEYEGTGIGLAHCKKIVELHNGKIWVESELGKGSTFVFTIPL